MRYLPNETMKLYFLAFILTPFFCIAQQNRNQTTDQKSSGTDCPTWKKKDVKANKADYFQYLKTSKSQKKQPVATSTSLKDNSNDINSHTASESKENSTAPKTNNKPIEKSVSEKRSKTVVAESDNQAQVADNKQNTLLDKPQTKPAQDEPIAKTAKLGEQNADSEKADKPASNKNEKLEDEKTKAKQKLTRFTRKTTKVRKHSNSKCPSF